MFKKKTQSIPKFAVSERMIEVQGVVAEIKKLLEEHKMTFNVTHQVQILSLPEEKEEEKK